MTHKTIAIIQPYFFPYLGYYSLFARADEVVVLDCVQFPRRGRVHRCQLPTEGRPNWLTLPLAKQSQSVRIADLRFAENARSSWVARLSKQNWYSNSAAPSGLRDVLDIRTGSVADYLCHQIRFVCELFGLGCRVSRSATLCIDPDTKRQDRIIAIAKAVGATHYINSPGGRELYQRKDFCSQGLSLQFLPQYGGAYFHLLPALFGGQRKRIVKDLIQYSSQPLQQAD